MLDLGGFLGESQGGGGGGGGCWPAGGGGRHLSICYRKRVLIMTRGPCKLRFCGNSLSGHFGLRVK
jgi:hypothetical protein